MSGTTKLPLVIVALFVTLGCEQSQTSATKETVQIYESHCGSCHEVGAANAPRRGDDHQWSKRLKKGEDQLITSVKAGLVAMPPKGGCERCSDDDFRAVIRYMSND